MTHIIKSRLLCAAAMPLLLSMVAPHMAVAQEDGASDGNGEGAIVVTARRREESLLDVPVSVTAFSGARLETQGAIDITDISNVTPNTTLENSRGTNNSLAAFIRGVGQQDPVSGFESGVGIYLDDVYLNRPQAAVLDIYDVERIEVLRGPQGTLYGRNTIGGAVKYVVARLPETATVKIKASTGTYQQADVIVSASTPLNDIIRVGVSGARLSRGGFGDNLNQRGVENYNKDVWAGRASLEIGGKDAPVLIRISGDYTRDKSEARNGHRLIPGLLTGAPVLDDVYDTRAGLSSPKQDVEAYGLAMNAAAELSDTVTFKSISAWRRDVSFTPIDFDSLPAADVDVPAIYRNNQVSQEFQLLYESDKLNGLVGFYYLDAKSSTAFDVLLSTTINNFVSYTFGDVRTNTWSVFGDVTYDFTDQLSLSVGGRYTNDKRRSRILRKRQFGPSPEFGGTPVPFTTDSDFIGSAKFTEFTPRASLSFKPSDDHMLFASYSKGFKGGGFDPRGLSSAAPDTNLDGTRSYQEIYDFLSFDPETVESYEIGWKGSLFDRRVTMAITGFYADYKDVQIPGSAGFDADGDGTFDSFIGVTTNAGKARMKGIEVETRTTLARGFAGGGSAAHFTGTLGYIDGEYREFINNVGVDVAKFRGLQNTPKWTASGTLDASAAVGEGMLTATSTLSYRSKTQQFEAPSPYLDQKGYALLDASLVYSMDGGRYTVGLHGKNLTNRRYKTSGYQFVAVNSTTGLPVLNGSGLPTPTLGKEGTVTAFYGNPRQVFVSIGAKF